MIHVSIPYASFTLLIQNRLELEVVVLTADKKLRSCAYDVLAGITH